MCRRIALLRFHFIRFRSSLVFLTGFEPVAYCLEGSCSIQLSYENICLRTLVVEYTVLRPYIRSLYIF